jgi:hypothetical protein
VSAPAGGFVRRRGGAPARGRTATSGRSRWAGLAAGALVAIALLGAVGWWDGRGGAVPSGGGPPSRAPLSTQPAQPLQAAEQGPPARPSPSLLGAEPLPTAPPAGVTWRVWRSIALPYSPDAGPARLRGDVAGGFARSPAGALLAAVHASSRKVAAGDPGWRDVAASMLAPGPGRDAWIAARSRVQHLQAPETGTFAQVAGFQFVSWSSADAVVQLASRNADGSFGLVALHLAWQDDDWRLVLAADGGDAASKQRAASLGGFVAWGGV